MKKRLKMFCAAATMTAILWAVVSVQTYAQTYPITLDVEEPGDVIAISSFEMNSRNEFFLYSNKLFKVFKFKPDGSFEKHFCRTGDGPGEVRRVLWMFLNPANDCLYLPEYASPGKGRVTIYDSSGTYKGLLKPELPQAYMDRIFKLLFLKNSSYFLVTSKRVDWKPAGKFFVTQQERQVKYFDSGNKLKADIFKTVDPGELSHAKGWGGPNVFFKPETLVKLTPEEQVAIVKTDNNTIDIYDRRGKKVNTVTLEIERQKLSDKEFNKVKVGYVEWFKTRSDARMVMLAKNMIQLEYKPFFSDFHFTPTRIVLPKTSKQDADGYTLETRLLLFDRSGKRVGEKIVSGRVLNIRDGLIFIKSYDEEGGEHFRIERFE